MSDGEGFAQTPVTLGAAVAIARIEATLDGVKRQIDHQDRNTGQLVKVFEERMMGRLDDLARRLDEMERAREAARREAMTERQAIEVRLRELEEKSQVRVEAVAAKLKAEHDSESKELQEALLEMSKRVTHIEDFRTKVVGIGIGAGMASGGVFALVAKAIGAM